MTADAGGPGRPAVGRRALGADASVRANRYWWDFDADAYHQEHGAFLGDADFVWCPEGVREDSAHLLGPTAELAGLRILEVGCGAAMCSRWLAAHGARPIALDLSAGMLRHARAGTERTGVPVGLLQADAQWLPLRTGSVDHAFTSFGAIPFVADSARVMREVARVLRPGGRWVFSTAHPMRWAFPDDPGPGGLVASGSYFDRTPYVETDAEGQPTYAEHHRTVGDRIRELRAAGFVLEDLVEPPWPDGFTGTWGQWSPLRGAHFPGTAIFCCRLAGPVAVTEPIQTTEPLQTTETTETREPTRTGTTTTPATARATAAAAATAATTATTATATATATTEGRRR